MDPIRISHFELVRLLGRGGMGEVHEALDLKLRRRVALKFLSPELTVDAEALARFEREAHAAADLSHPHIATVYAFEPEGNAPFIAMELLAGPSLRQRIGAGPMPIAEAAGIARDVAAALAFAHRRGIAHRDIKPENLMFDEHGKIKVMDFGLARATMSSKLTMTGTSLGTPAYMSPEAIRGDSGPPSDVFALGLVLYEMLSGRRAYPGENVMSVMFSIANDPPEPLTNFRDDVPEELSGAVDRMIEKDPSRRVDAATIAAELAVFTGVPVAIASSAFAPVSDGSDALTTQQRTLAVSPAIGSTQTTVALPARTALATGDAATSATLPPARGGRPLALLVGGVVLVAAAAGTWLWSGIQARNRAEAAERLQMLGTEAGQADSLDRAKQLFQQALVLDPAQAGALNNLGLIALSEQRYTTAESLFNAILKHHGKDRTVRAAALHNLAECDIARKAFDRAVTRLRESLALDAGYPGAYNNLAWALLQNGQPGEALECLKLGIAKYPGESFLYKNAGVAERELGNLDAAIGFLDTAVRLDSTFTEASELRDQARLERSRKVGSGG